MKDTEFAVPAIPDHELLRRIGRGSYGEVWLARGVTGAYRAVKVVHRRSFSSDRPYEREFSGILKFEPVSRTHFGLVSVLHVGRNLEAGHFYYVMEVADDIASGRDILPERYAPKTLGAWLKQGPLPLAECVRVGSALSDALAHLHAASLVHRDIKPSNIIFVEGLPKLADIGLVTEIGEKATFVGTEGYIPPEGPGSPGADIYGLGKVLYEMSTGKPCDEFPDLPSEFRSRPDAELFARWNAVVVKACDLRPAHRHPSAGNLYAEIVSISHLPSPILSGGMTAQQPGADAGKPRALVLFECSDGKDARVAGLLEERLAAAGWKVLLNDSTEFSVAWARRFEQQIADTQAVIVLLSEGSAGEAAFNYQLDVALRAAANRSGGPLLLPVRLAYAGPFPGALGFAKAECPALGWRDESDDERLVEEVAGLLNSRIITCPPRGFPA